MCIFPSNNCRRCHLTIHLTFVEAVIGFGTRQWRAHMSMGISMLARGQLHSLPCIEPFPDHPLGLRCVHWGFSLLDWLRKKPWQALGMSCELLGKRIGRGGGFHYTKSGISKGSGKDPGQAYLLLQRIFASLGWKQLCSVNSPRVTKFLRLENEMDKQ